MRDLFSKSSIVVVAKSAQVSAAKGKESQFFSALFVRVINSADASPFVINIEKKFCIIKMAQFGGNKNPPWAQGAGGRPGQPGQAGTGAIDVPGLVGAFGAAAAAAGGPGGPHVFHQGGPAGLPPGLAGHLGVPGSHGPAVTLAAMASQPVRNLHLLFQPFFLLFQKRNRTVKFLSKNSTIFLGKSKLSTTKYKTATFSRVFEPKSVRQFFS